MLRTCAWSRGLVRGVDVEPLRARSLHRVGGVVNPSPATLMCVQGRIRIFAVRPSAVPGPDTPRSTPCSPPREYTQDERVRHRLHPGRPPRGLSGIPTEYTDELHQSSTPMTRTTRTTRTTSYSTDYTQDEDHPDDEDHSPIRTQDRHRINDRQSQRNNHTQASRLNWAASPRKRMDSCRSGRG